MNGCHIENGCSSSCQPIFIEPNLNYVIVCNGQNVVAVRNSGKAFDNFHPFLDKEAWVKEVEDPTIAHL